MEKVDHRKSYWNLQGKTGVATHFFEIITLESEKKEEKDTSLQISIELAEKKTYS